MIAHQVYGKIFVVVMATSCVASVCGTAWGQGLSRVNNRHELMATAEQFASEQVIIQASNMAKWPKSDRVTVAPLINRSLLPGADLITDEQRSYSVIFLDKKSCAVLNLNWRRLEKSKELLPTQLPEEMRKGLEDQPEIMNLSEAERQRYFDKKLELYRQSKAIDVTGTLDVKVAAADSPSAAHEWLIYESIEWNSLASTKVVVDQFTNKIESLGDIAFTYESRAKDDRTIRMARGNIAVVIRGNGVFVDEVKKLAVKIDAAIAKEPAVADLNTMRPKVTVGTIRESTAAKYRQNALPLNVAAPHGQEIVRIKATIDGDEASVTDGEVLLGTNKGQLNFTIHVITDRLMVTTITTQASVDDVKGK